MGLLNSKTAKRALLGAFQGAQEGLQQHIQMKRQEALAVLRMEHDAAMTDKRITADADAAALQRDFQIQQADKQNEYQVKRDATLNDFQTERDEVNHGRAVELATTKGVMDARINLAEYEDELRSEVYGVDDNVDFAMHGARKYTDAQIAEMVARRRSYLLPNQPQPNAALNDMTGRAPNGGLLGPLNQDPLGMLAR